MPSGGRAVLHDARSLTSKTCKKLSHDINRMEIISPSKLLRMGIITLSFFTITNSFQRLAGSLSIHSGRPFIATRVFGALSTAASCLLSLELQELLVSPLEDGKLVPTVKKTALSRVIPNLGAYYCLERRSFLTAIPSSVIAIGVHAQQNFYAAKGSVVSTNKVATKGQRNLVQMMGKNFGCHQCGSKRWNKIFIADHMPPTYFVNEMNQVWWRKMLKKKVRLSICLILLFVDRKSVISSHLDWSDWHDFYGASTTMIFSTVATISVLFILFLLLSLYNTSFLK